MYKRLDPRSKYCDNVNKTVDRWTNLGGDAFGYVIYGSKLTWELAGVLLRPIYRRSAMISVQGTYSHEECSAEFDRRMHNQFGSPCGVDGNPELPLRIPDG